MPKNVESTTTDCLPDVEHGLATTVTVVDDCPVIAAGHVPSNTLVISFNPRFPEAVIVTVLPPISGPLVGMTLTMDPPNMISVCSDALLVNIAYQLEKRKLMTGKTFHKKLNTQQY